MGNKKVSKKKTVPAPKGRRSAAPTKKPFRLEVGKYYRNRRGDLRGPMTRNHKQEDSFYEFSDGSFSYHLDGRHCDGGDCHLNLIREAPSPKSKGKK